MISPVLLNAFLSAIMYIVCSLNIGRFIQQLPVSSKPFDGSTVPLVRPTRCTCYLKLFILVKRSTCFGRSFRPSAGGQNCVYSNGICQTSAAKLRLKCDDTCAETRFRLSPKRTSQFKPVGASVQSTTGSRVVRISGNK